MAAELGQATDGAAKMAMIERSILALLLVGLLIGVIAVVKPFTTAILFGAALATAAWPMRQALVRRRLGRGSAAALLLVLSLVLVVLPLLAFAPHLADQLVSGAQRVQLYFAATPDQPTWIKGVPLFGRRLGAAWDRIVEVGAANGIVLRPCRSHRYVRCGYPGDRVEPSAPDCGGFSRGCGTAADRRAVGGGSKRDDQPG
jgi:predicted PurR-regulated permease PerM